MIGKRVVDLGIATACLGMAVGIAIAPKAAADPAQDHEFIDRVGEYVEIVDAPAAIEVAQAVCTDIENGYHAEVLAEQIWEHQDVKPDTARAFVQVSADVYCPDEDVDIIELSPKAKTKIV